MSDLDSGAAGLRLEVQEAVLLCHALIDHVARSLGIRVLFLKGPAAREQGLRPHGASSDVDVLVPPSDRAALAEELGRRGWYLRPGSDRVQGAPLHSTTLIHDSWNCDIDIHHRFPGIGIEPQAAFERLWRRHETVRLAERPVPVPCREDGVVTLALHALRPDFRVVRDFSEELARLAEVARAMPRRAVLDAARALGADGCLLPFLRGLHSAAELAGASPVPADWQLREASSRLTAHSSLWLLSLQRLPARERPRLLFRALWPRAGEIVASDRAAGHAHRTVLGARLSRWARGISKTPVYLSDLRRLNRGGDRTR